MKTEVKGQNTHTPICLLLPPKANNSDDWTSQRITDISIFITLNLFISAAQFQLSGKKEKY